MRGFSLPTVLPVAASLGTGDMFGGSIADPHARWQAQDGIAELRKCSKQLRGATVKTLASVIREAATRGPYAGAGRRACFIVFLVHYNSSLPLGAAPEALRAP